MFKVALKSYYIVPDCGITDYYTMKVPILGAQNNFTPREYENKTVQEIVDTLPQEYRHDVISSIRQHIDSGVEPVLVILDDDPTGTQTCHDVVVLTVWDHEVLCREFRNGSSGFFILTNSRAFPPDEAYELIHTITQNLRRASEETGREFEIVLRGDSTLRGHLPQEPEAVENVLGKFDGWIIAPFFYQGGRYTIHDVHYVREGDKLMPVSKTPFAEDASFGFRSSNLRDYVKEKCGARVTDDDFVSVSIEDIRQGGPQTVAKILFDAPKGCIVIVNAAAESDMYVVAAGLLEVEKKGKRFLYRTGAAFVSARLGITRIDPLTMQDLGIQRSDEYAGGFIVAGSYVPKTTAQLECLRLERGERLHTIELDVETMISSEEDADKITRAATSEATDRIKKGEDVLIMTSRKLITGGDSASSLKIGNTIAATLVRIVKNLDVRPRYIIAKGGITSSDAATKGLQMKRALIIGQAAAGVPLWRCNEETSRHRNVPYVVFPGNVGAEDALAKLVERWSLS